MSTKNVLLQVQDTAGNRKTMQVSEKHTIRNKRKVRTWSTEEDQLLLALYDEHPKQWAIIASGMGDRNQNQCLHRFRRLSQAGKQRKIWSDEEDEAVRKLIKKFGKNWKLLSEILGTKTGKQIRERYINKLDPKIKREEWTQEEDMHLIELYLQIGSKWSQIAKKLPGRPENRIKNRFYSYIKRNYNIRETEEDKKSIHESTIGDSLGSHQPSQLDNKLSLTQAAEESNSNTSMSEIQMDLEGMAENERGQEYLSSLNSKLCLEGGNEVLKEITSCNNIGKMALKGASLNNIQEDDYMMFLDGRTF